MVVVALAATGAASAAPEKPRRVMSMNLCTDALVLSLLPPERIVSVTYLSRSSGNSALSGRAHEVGVNYGSAEEVLAQRPDLVIAGASSTAATRMLLKRIGAPLIEVPAADDFDQIRVVTRRIGAAVGEPGRAEALIARMDATLAELARTRPPRRISVVGWDGGGAVPGRGTLFDAILTAAGGVNIGADMHGDRAGSFDLEQLLAAHPDVLAFGDADADKPALRTIAAQHPILRQLYAGRRIVYPELLYSCGIPQSADAAVALRRALLAAAHGPTP